MPTSMQNPEDLLEKKDRVADLDHRPRVLLGKIGLDGHDRGVKLIARALRDSGIHVIYSGLWQSPRSLAISARDEDVDCVAASMMSNSHLVLIPRLIGECKNVGRPDMVINIGGIIPQEDVQSMYDAGVTEVHHTGTSIEEVINSVRRATKPYAELDSDHDTARLARNISMAVEGRLDESKVERKRPQRVIGITGSPGAGKSTLLAAIASEAVRNDRGRVAMIAFDPQSPITSGALLGDRLRVDFNALDEAVFYRSLAITGEDYQTLPLIIELIGAAGFDTVIVETVGAGQNDVAIKHFVDQTAVVLVPGMGDAIQMDKAGILEIADLFVVNKADFPGEANLVRDLMEVAGGRPIFETVATRSRGIPELLEGLMK
ncbi:MAG: cobalamin-dependent protein [Planctomycetota bacterium]